MYKVFENSDYDTRGDDCLLLLWGYEKHPNKWSVSYAGNVASCWSKPKPLYPDSFEVDWPYNALLRHFGLTDYPIDRIFETSPEELTKAANKDHVPESSDIEVNFTPRKRN